MMENSFAVNVLR